MFAKIMNFIAGGINVIYAAVSLPMLFIIWGGYIEAATFFFLVAGARLKASLEMSEILIRASEGIFVLGIVTLAANLMLAKGSKGKSLGVVASALSIFGFLLGWIPIISTIYQIVTIALYIVAAAKINVSKNHEYHCVMYQVEQDVV